MKRLLIFLTGLLLWSCTVPRDINGELQGEWIFQNETSLDLNIYHELIYSNKPYEDVNSVYNWMIISNSVVSVKYERFYNDNMLTFSTFFTLYEKDIISCRMYITNTNGEVVKEWMMGKDNGPHDIFKEENWDYRQWETEHEELFFGTYIAEHHEWTFTITDEDIGLAE